MKTKLMLLSMFAASLSLAACSPSSRGTIPVPDVPPVKASELDRPVNNDTNVTVAVKPLLDGRQVALESDDTTVNRVVTPKGAVGSAVSSALSQSLIRKGLLVTNNAPLTVSGEILKWRTDIMPGVTKSVKSTAQIHIEVVDARGNKHFTGNYAGEQSLSQPIVKDSDVDKSLGLAMQGAMAELVQDRQFLAALWDSAEQEHRFRMERTPAEIR